MTYAEIEAHIEAYSLHQLRRATRLRCKTSGLLWRDIYKQLRKPKQGNLSKLVDCPK